MYLKGGYAVEQHKKIMFIDLDKKNSESLAAIDSSGMSITYGGLLDFADEWKDSIHSRSLILIIGDNTIGGIAGYIGSMIHKIVPIIVGVGIKDEALNHLKSTYKPQFIWKPRNLLSSNEKEVFEKYDYVLVENEKVGYPLYDDLCLLLTTSGSTGSPKLVRHRYLNLEAQARNISRFFELDSADRPLVSLPIQYTMAISSINSHLYVGATLLLTSMSLLSPDLWTFVKTERATSITGVPYSFELMYKLRIYRQDIPSLKLLTQGGGKLDKTIQITFAEYIQKKGGKYIATYGQTEGSARMAYLPNEYAISKCGSIGKAIPNGKLYIVDEAGNEVKQAGKIGEMVFEGDNVTLGYAENGSDLIRGDDNKGVLHTGDLVYKDDDGFFFIVGRKKRFLKLYGHRVSLDECEQLIKNKYKIECACTGTDKMLKIYITDKEYEDCVKKYILSETELYANSITVICIESIPKNEAGKTLYAQLD